MKGLLPSNLYIYFLCLSTRYATASKHAIANTASKPGSFGRATGVVATGVVVTTYPFFILTCLCLWLIDVSYQKV